MKDLDQYTDTVIINKVLSGEPALFEILIRRYNAALYKVGRSYNYDHEDTQDLMQDTFIDTYKNLAQFKGDSNFKTWIIRIMLNNCYHKKERNSFKTKKMEEIKNHSQTVSVSAGNDIEKKIQTRELGNIIENALAKIPEDYRLVFSLREMNGMSVAETATLLNTSETNIKVRLNRAKSKLRSEIEKSYSAVELFEFNAIYCNAMTERVMHIINQL